MINQTVRVNFSGNLKKISSSFFAVYITKTFTFTYRFLRYFVQSPNFPAIL